MAWSTSQNNQKSFNPEKINLREIIINEFESFNISAINKEITMDHSIAPGLHLTADIQMVKVIFRNLISNAIKYSYAGGVIFITVTESKQFVEIWVKDNGVGISQKTLYKLFKADEFHSTVGTNNEHGSGFGPLFCKEFIEMHGGKIWVESETGKGTVCKLHYHITFKNMKPTLEMPDKAIEEVVIALNTLLADEHMLYTKIRNVYWNYSSPSHYELHKFFKIQYELLEEMVNNIVKRVHSLGFFVLGSMKDFLSVTRLTEGNDNFDHSTLITKTLITDHETIAIIIRKEIIPLTNKLNDLITTDLVTGIMEQHEKMAWMLSTFLSEPAFNATKHIRTITKQLANNQEINIKHQNLMPERRI